MKRARMATTDHSPLKAASLLLLVAIVLIAPRHAAAQPPQRVTILYTSNTNGIMRSCHCAGNLFGSLPQRARFIRAVREKGTPVLLVDAGDLFPAGNDGLKAQYIAKCYALMGYDAIGIGERELACGTAFLQALIAEERLPFTSANINARDTHQPLVAPVITRNLAGTTIGIVSIISPRAFSVQTVPLPTDVEILPAKAELEKQLARLKGKADLNILLSHLGLAADREIARTVPGIDVVVGAHSGEALQAPLRVNNTLIVQAGKNTEYVGVLELALRPVELLTHRLAPLIDLIPDDKETARIASEYRAARFRAFRTRARKPTPKALSRFVPSQACRKCHQEQYKAWAKTKHAHAFRVLKEKGRAGDSECYTCHTTGSGMETGFVTPAETPQFVGVHCQCCHLVDATHGDNKQHVIPSAPIVPDTCIGCHNAFNSPKFDYTSYRARIRH